MAIVYENVELVATNIILLLVICLVGIPGNLIAIAANKGNLGTNSVNSVVYLHMAIVDVFICIAHALPSLILESVGYYSPGSDLGSWTPVLVFLARVVSLRVYFLSTFISACAVTLIALLRCWRMFNPFGILRKKWLFVGIIMLDLSAVAFAVLLSPNARRSESNSETFQEDLNETSTSNFSNENSFVFNLDGFFNDNPNGTANITNTEFGPSASSNIWLEILRIVAFVTMSVTLICYVLICFKIGCQQKSMISESDVGKKLFVARQKKHLVTQVVLLSALIACILPSVLISLFGLSNFALSRLAMTLSTLNSAINPFIYCLLTPAIRTKILKRFRKPDTREDSKITATSHCPT